MPAEHDTTPKAQGGPQSGPPRTHGFRFSRVDGVVLLLASGMAGWLAAAGLGDLALLVGFTVGHFFLFCNVFRVRRAPELIWAGVFLCNATLAFGAGAYPFAWACAAQMLLTIFLIHHETRQPWYHGILARRWNPRGLDAYLRGGRVEGACTFLRVPFVGQMQCTPFTTSSIPGIVILTSYFSMLYPSEGGHMNSRG